MARLIDADALLEELKGMTCTDKHDSMVIKQVVVNIVEKQPTAYDVDKVIQQLREQDGTCTGCNHSPDECAWCSVNERLDIVRKGGVE